MLIRYFLIIMFLLLNGCATSVDRVGTTVGKSNIPKRNSNSFSISTDASFDLFNTQAQLAEAARALEQNDLARAKLILQLMPPPQGTLITEYLLLSAQTALEGRLATSALSFLADKRIQKSELERGQKIKFAKIKSDAYLLNRSFIASAEELISVDRLFQGNERADNHERIYELLMEVPSRSLAIHADKEIESSVRGWLSLAALTKQNENDPLLQLQALNKWKLAWSHHTAAKIMPRSLEMLSKIVSERPNKIALFLPFQGALSSVGKAIRDGFIGGYFAHQDDTTVILSYDTTNANMTDLVDRAKKEGVQLIVGPINKDNVTELAAMDLEIPTLALNRTSNRSLNAQLYQFGLAPEDEITQVVKQVQNEGLKDALVIYPDSVWGKRNFSVFEQEWVLSGGSIVNSATFSKQRDYSKLIKALLNIDESEERAKELRRITGHSFEFTPRRRQDIDFILLLANPGQARGINPTLEHFYAEDIPVYATSHIYESSTSWIDAIDLDGIQFCDIPWKLTTLDRVQKEIQNTWSGAQGRLAAFYAMGLDAYRLYPRLQQLKELPNQKLFGATGVLTISQNNVIKRELLWAQFKDGKPIRITF